MSRFDLNITAFDSFAMEKLANGECPLRDHYDMMGDHSPASANSKKEGLNEALQRMRCPSAAEAIQLVAASLVALHTKLRRTAEAITRTGLE